MKKKVRKFEDGFFKDIEVEAPEEVGVNIYVNSRHLTTISATPESLEELVIGFLFTEAIIESVGEVKKISSDSSYNFSVELKGDFSYELARTKIVTAGCAGGQIAAVDLKKLKPVANDCLCLSPEEILAFTKESIRRFSKNGRKRGIHHASALTRDGLVFVQSDIGRHNALDKVAGQLLKEGKEAIAVFATGRLSSEMVVKAIRLKACYAISLSSPTSSAITLGERHNIALIGYARGNSFEIYSGFQRFMRE
jgi:FdhD protein